MNIFLDTLIQKRFIQIIKINKFRGDLSRISAKKTSLLSTVISSNSDVTSTCQVILLTWSPPHLFKTPRKTLLSTLYQVSSTFKCTCGLRVWRQWFSLYRYAFLSRPIISTLFFIADYFRTTEPCLPTESRIDKSESAISWTLVDCPNCPA